MDVSSGVDNRTMNDMSITPGESSTRWNSALNLESNGVSVIPVTSSNGSVPTSIPVSSSSTTSSSSGCPGVSKSLVQGRGLTITPERKPISIVHDGMAECEQCGSFGVKHAFYTKKRNYCSPNCVQAAKEKLPHETITRASNDELMGTVNEDGGRGSPTSSESTNDGSRSSGSEFSDLDFPPPKRNKIDSFDPNNFNWVPHLDKPNFNAASVTLFKHAPVAYLWENVTVGMKVEVENKDVDGFYNQTAFWVASVTKIQGYKVRLRFEGFGVDGSGDFWVNLCSEDVHHVGWCATKGKPLIPPRAISSKFTDWRDFLVKRLTGARTLPQNFQAKVKSGLKSKYELHSELEVVDKNRISQLRLASVEKIVGKRLHIKYFNSEDGGFWCHEDSPLIHPRGWSRTVGHEILAPKTYQPDLLPKTIFNDDSGRLDLRVGMKLEAIDPLNLSTICAATIKKVLNYGYIMVRVDCYDEDFSGSDWFCYHVTSPYVFPCGFAERNKIVLTPPLSYSKDSFRWEEYLSATKSKPAPIQRPPSYENQAHGFKVGMKVEAADLMDPRLICVATIGRVVGRLLKIHFDGWEEEYDQWLDAFSPDVYPIGWTELVGHRLEPPRPPSTAQPLPAAKKKPKGKKKIQNLKGKLPHKNIGGKVLVKKVKKVEGVETPPQPSPSSGGVTRKQSSIVPGSSTSTTTSPIKEQKVEATPPPPPPPPQNNGITITRITQGENGSPIPRLNDPPNNMGEVDPSAWTTHDVASFLELNESGAYKDSFQRNNIDGKTFVRLNKDQLVVLTGMKVGPALKILDLINNLVRLVSNAKARKSALAKLS